MARKNYSDEFRRQAVDLYESTAGSTVRGIADDLGVERGTLRHWLELYGTGKKTAADGTLTRSPLNPGLRGRALLRMTRTRRHPSKSWSGSGPGSPSLRRPRRS